MEKEPSFLQSDPSESEKENQGRLESLDDIKKYFSDPNNDEAINKILIKADKAQTDSKESSAIDYREFKTKEDYQKALENYRSSLYALSGLAGSDSEKQAEILNNLAQTGLQGLKSAAENAHLFGFEVADSVQDAYRVVESYAKENFPEEWENQTIEERAKDNFKELTKEYNEFRDNLSKLLDDKEFVSAINEGRFTGEKLDDLGIKGEQAQVIYGDWYPSGNMEGSLYSLFGKNNLRVRWLGDHAIYLNGSGNYMKVRGHITEEGNKEWELVPGRINKIDTEYFQRTDNINYFKALNETTQLMKEGLRKTLATFDEYQKSKKTGNRLIK